MTANAVVAPHFLSARAGRHILDDGGTAVDAAIAMVATQGVVAPETCGLGGDLFALVHQPGWDRPAALNASGRAGSKASPATLRDIGHITIPRDHPLTATIPGCVDGLVALSDRFGSMTLSEALEPAVALATEGFPASTEQAGAFATMAAIYRDNRAVAGFFPEGRPIAVGETVKRPELARTLTDLGTGGREAFYGGQPGRDITKTLHPYVTAEDLDQSQSEWVYPISRPIGVETAWMMPPNSPAYLGPATLAVFLRLDPPDDPTDPLWWHLLIEAHRSLAWQREQLVADPDFLDLPPQELVSDSRLDAAAAEVSPDQARTWPTRPLQPTGTAYMCVSDASGMSVSVINSNYRGLGSPFGAENSGFLLHDRGAGFNLQPGHRNELGPNKRPAHTLSPTIWTRGAETSWVLGTRGGGIQPQLVAQMAARAIAMGQNLEDAQNAPRWTMSRYGPGERSSVSIEPGTAVVADLERLGHDVYQENELQPGWGPMSIIDRTGDEIKAASDPRIDTTEALIF